MYVCICQGITDKQIRTAVRNGVTSMTELQFDTGCSTVCGTCGDLASEILNEELTKTESHAFLPVLSISSS